MMNIDSLLQRSVPRVLSVQSHVVSGYVGNRVAVVALQFQGFDVDFINTVSFSNHTGYPVFRGPILSKTQFLDIMDGLEQNDLLSYDFLLTGYLGSSDSIENIVSILEKIQSRNPNIKYICDPVFGDDGRFYVSETIIPLCKEHLIKRAFLVTPNQFEAELLTGRKISNEKDAIQAMIDLVGLGPQNVVLTSTEFSSSNDHKLYCYTCHEMKLNAEEFWVISRIRVDKVEGYFTGTGDLTAALLLSWIEKLQSMKQERSENCDEDYGAFCLNMVQSIESEKVMNWTKIDNIGQDSVNSLNILGLALQLVLASVQSIIQITQGHSSLAEPTNMVESTSISSIEHQRARKSRSRELQIIRGASYLMDPPLNTVENPQFILLPKV